MFLYSKPVLHDKDLMHVFHERLTSPSYNYEYLINIS